jgi:signal transduction histidine kinase
MRKIVKPQVETKVGDAGYINKDCWLAKNLNYPPSSRCQSCESKFYNCLFFHYLIVSLILVIVIFALFFFIEGKISKLVIISVFLLILIYGYFFNKNTEKIIQANFAQKKAKEALQRLTNDLKQKVNDAVKELDCAYRELKKLDDSKTEFLSLASHQLRTPLSAIKGYISMILEGNYGPLEKETEGALKDVYQSNERLISLVNDLLNITRIEAGRMEYRPKETDFAKLVEGVLKELEMTAKNKNLELKFKIAKVPMVNIDPDKIRQVLMNLIDNAIKYTQNGSIVVHVKKVDGQIMIEVKDTGIGISKNKKETLFQWFSRGKGALRLDAGGFGLGLYIAKKIVEKANGKIWAESKGEGKGSTFTFTLPIK